MKSSLKLFVLFFLFSFHLAFGGNSDSLQYQQAMYAGDLELEVSYSEAEFSFGFAFICAKTDLEKADALNGWGKALYRRESFEAALQKYNFSLLLYKKLGDENSQMKVYANMAYAYRLVDTAKSASCIKKALMLSEKVDDIELFWYVHHAKGTLLYLNNRYFQALNVFGEVLKMAPTPLEKAKTLRSLAKIYQDLGYNDEALEYYSDAKRICPSESILVYSSILNDFGTYYKSLGEYDKALDCYDQALMLRSSIPVLKAASLKSIGMLWKERADKQKEFAYYSKVLEYYLQALNIYQNHNMVHQVAIITSLWGKVLFAANPRDSLALSYYQSAYQIDTGYIATPAVYFANIGEWYIANSFPNEAKIFYLSALKASGLSPEHKVSIYKNLIQLDSSNAIRYQLAMLNFQRKLDETRQKKEFDVLFAQRDLDLRDQKTFWVYVVFSLIIFAGGIVFILTLRAKRRKSKLNKELQQKNREIQEKNTQLEQINKQLILVSQKDRENQKSARNEQILLRSLSYRVFYETVKHCLFLDYPMGIVGGDSTLCSKQGDNFYIIKVDVEHHGPKANAYVPLLQHIFLDMVASNPTIPALSVVEGVEKLLYKNYESFFLSEEERLLLIKTVAVSVLKITNDSLEIANTLSNFVRWVSKNGKVETFVDSNQVLFDLGDDLFKGTVFQSVVLQKEDIVSIHIASDGLSAQLGGDYLKSFHFAQSVQNVHRILSSELEYSIREKGQRDDILLVSIEF